MKHVKKYVDFKFKVGDHVKYKDFYKKIKSDDPTVNDIFEIVEQKEYKNIIYYIMSNGKEEVLRLEGDLKIAEPKEVKLYLYKIKKENS